eukprot:8641156-Alexandrium_andersonii.AAC.1
MRSRIITSSLFWLASGPANNGCQQLQQPGGPLEFPHAKAVSLIPPTGSAAKAGADGGGHRRPPS